MPETAAHTPSELVPPTLEVVSAIGDLAEGRAWLSALPGLIAELRDAWALRLGAPWTGGTCSWVAPAELPDGRPAALKISWPHREMLTEADALRVWHGHGAVELYAHDPGRHALLLEQADPGTTLGAATEIPAEERLIVAAGLLCRLWSAPVPPTEPSGSADPRPAAPASPGSATSAQPGSATSAGSGASAGSDASSAAQPGVYGWPTRNVGATRHGGFERVGTVTAEWADLVEDRMARLRPGFDPGLVGYGARLLRELPGSAAREVLVHGDVNPGNILAARREPWLVIDAKPMWGDPAYDPWPLIEQVDDPFLHGDPVAVLRRRFALFGEVTGEDPARLAAWAVARRVETALWAVSRGNPDGGARVMAEAATLAPLTDR